MNIMENEILIAPGKYAQFHFEIRSWERLLEFFKQENAYLKNRLSEVLDLRSDKAFLPLAEHFQNLFIIKDEFMDELRHDIHEQESLLKKVGISARQPADIKLKKQEKLRNEMEYLERDFIKVKIDFNKYLLSVL